MGVVEEGPRRLGAGQVFTCPYCGLPQDRMPTLDHDWVLLEPDVTVLAHLVPAEHRWIVLSDGPVTVYGVCPPVAEQRCRIEHRLTCPGQELPDLWPWLTAMREESRRASERRDGGHQPPEPDIELPDVG
ncbi:MULTISPECIES: DUF6083 domain-containing protein [Streptomyces]|jgi:hypothetical protein|uniref:DUF6083 domain-containing protein n=1 Tax=Streptomyces TaxID=1883 RepID=UPI000C1AC79A|nr:MULTISPECIES: DUF6083 domain-containing protein [Streptomyces]QIY94200.1 hypothetical protein HEP87_09295 [Streptomyces sp. S1D4-11]